jgi:hypothetical protein
VTGKVLASHADIGRSEMGAATVREGVLRFTLRAGDERMQFEIKVPEAEGAKMLGTVNFGRSLLPAVLERTTLTSLDENEVHKDVLANSKDPAALMRSAMSLVNQAGFLKAKPEDVRAWVDKAIKASEPFGERWQREVLLKLVDALNEQDGMAQVALPYARRLERMLLPKDRPSVHKQILETLASALERAGKADEAKEVTGRIEKIDLSVRTQTYPGRGEKSTRVAVMELFTGTECPPCVAADLGFDALVKTFKPADVVLLQYHVHIPGPDPLTTEQTFGRLRYYNEAFGGEVRGTPSTLIHGTPAAGGGGGKAQAQDKYDQYYDALVARLDEEAKVKLTAKAVRKGDKIDIDADVADLAEAGASVKLRLVLVEDEIEYKGGNGVERHHHVVRAFPGGLDGVALKEKALKHKASVDLAEVRKEVKKYLEDFYKKNEEELPKQLPLDLKNLKVVALVQDDNTREILHAVQVDVEDAK